MNHQEDCIQIVELFMAQVSREERYYGTITRSKDSDGNPVVHGKIKVGNCFVFARSADDVALGKKLDELVWIVTRYPDLIR